MALGVFETNFDVASIGRNVRGDFMVVCLLLSKSASSGNSRGYFKDSNLLNLPVAFNLFVTVPNFGESASLASLSR